MAPRFLRRTTLQALHALAALLFVAGCTSIPRTPYSSTDAASARILDLRDLRKYADEPASAFLNEARARLDVGRRGHTYLALSGGGADGAYGAGVLNGWTVSGTRPSFTIVSGVSTGALIAPFAFLGSAYDPTLRDIYTSGIAASLVDRSSILGVVFGSGLFGNARLRELIGRYVDQNMLAAIAADYARGRDLFIVTTNLDSQRTVIWNMGRIAGIGSPEALSLFRDVVAASASIPVAFPPVLIGAEANGHRFEEMHVDGSVTAPILTLPEAFLLRTASLGHGQRMTMYVLINDRIDREFEVVPNGTFDIAARASSSLVKTQLRSILYETFSFSRRNDIGFKLTYIGKEVPSSGSSEFRTSYMQALYQYGYNKAKDGTFWESAPPSDGPARVEPRPRTVRTSQ